VDGLLLALGQKDLHESRYWVGLELEEVEAMVVWLWTIFIAGNVGKFWCFSGCQCEGICNCPI